MLGNTREAPASNGAGFSTAVVADVELGKVIPKLTVGLAAVIEGMSDGARPELRGLEAPNNNVAAAALEGADVVGTCAALSAARLLASRAAMSLIGTLGALSIKTVQEQYIRTKSEDRGIKFLRNI
jgi:hypothetical protein